MVPPARRRRRRRRSGDVGGSEESAADEVIGRKDEVPECEHPPNKLGSRGTEVINVRSRATVEDSEKDKEPSYLGSLVPTK